jgi:hypothetical protein
MAKPVWVSPDGDGWRVHQGGKTISNHDKKTRAESSGRREAVQDGAELIVQNRNGQIRRRDSHGNESAKTDKND